VSSSAITGFTARVSNTFPVFGSSPEELTISIVRLSCCALRLLDELSWKFEGHLYMAIDTDSR
jgi:hypothetical protein